MGRKNKKQLGEYLTASYEDYTNNIKNIFMVFNQPSGTAEIIVSLMRFPEVIRLVDSNSENNFFLIAVTEECNHDTLVRKLQNLGINMNRLYIVIQIGLSDQKYMQYDPETNSFVPSSQKDINTEKIQTQKSFTTEVGTQAHQLVGQIQ